MQMHDPIHPGVILKEMYLIPLKITVIKAAASLGISRKALSELLNSKVGVSTMMALRLAKAFNTTPEYWLDMQQQHDLWQAKKTANLKQIRRLVETAE
ncbi:MAG: addiction module antidote protein, HigA family [Candidatus Marinimicrobia bacterium CG1_02_48_14]|nr:MAG: addiction module antidote protein, HigA family [Candidatus Marinimicrobia bacterium CG1_02_48_14]